MIHEIYTAFKFWVEMHRAQYPGITPLFIMDALSVNFLQSVVNRLNSMGCDVIFIPGGCTYLRHNGMRPSSFINKIKATPVVVTMVLLGCFGVRLLRFFHSRLFMLFTSVIGFKLSVDTKLTLKSHMKILRDDRRNNEQCSVT